MDVVTEEMASEGCALMYADDLVLICETKEARRRFVVWRNALESNGLKVNISKMKVMRCAWDVAPEEAAVDLCSVCGERGWVLTQSTAKHVATGYMSDVQECEEVCWNIVYMRDVSEDEKCCV